MSRANGSTDTPTDADVQAEMFERFLGLRIPPEARFERQANGSWNIILPGVVLAPTGATYAADATEEQVRASGEFTFAMCKATRELKRERKRRRRNGREER